jgi:cytoskeletal protein RodZ
MRFSRLKALFIGILFCVGLAIAAPALSVTLAQTSEPQVTEQTTPEQTEQGDRTQADQSSAPQPASPDSPSKSPNPKGVYDPEAIKEFDRELYGTD